MLSFCIVFWHCRPIIQDGTPFICPKAWSRLAGSRGSGVSITKGQKNGSCPCAGWLQVGAAARQPLHHADARRAAQPRPGRQEGYAGKDA